MAVIDTSGTVFHYASAGAAIGLVKGSSIWASKIQHLNDEKEYIQYIEATRRLGRKLFGANESDESAFLDDLESSLSALMTANLFVASFTEHGDLLSQWRGYCPNGGYSLGLRRSDLERSFDAAGLRFCRAEYSPPSEPEISSLLEAAFRDHRSMHRELTPGSGLPALKRVADKILEEAPRYKHAGFSEEAEWRVYSPILSWDDFKIDVVDIRGRLRPIIRAPLRDANEAANTPKLEFTECFVSPGPDSELRREALVMLLRNNNCSYRSIHRSSIPYNPR
jgi:hypothetical protein